MIGITNTALNCNIEYPTLENPATASDIQSGKRAISGAGEVITGTYALPTLVTPATAANIQLGKQAIDANGNIITGTHAERSSVTLTLKDTLIWFKVGSKKYKTVTINWGQSATIYTEQGLSGGYSFTISAT